MLVRLFFISLILFLTSCDGQGDPNGYQEKLVGKWSAVNLNEVNEFYTDDYTEESRVLEFFADGTGTQVSIYGPDAPEDERLSELIFTYNVMYGNHVRYADPDDPQSFITYKILEMSDRHFIEKEPLEIERLFLPSPPNVRYERISN